MHATLHLPGLAPRSLTQAELTALNLGQESLQPQNAAALREVLGTAVPGELLASEVASEVHRYVVIGAENAADYDFAPNESGSTAFERLTGVKPDELLVGPLLILEA